MKNSLASPIDGGSVYNIDWDDERIEVYLPPIGFTINRMPRIGEQDEEPTYDLIPCEILYEDKPILEQKWKRTELPKDWKKWRREERENQEGDKFYINPNADKFRTQEWNRKVNGLWMCIGNRIGKPTEYIYLTGQAYDYFNWWKQDFGYPSFRHTLLKEFYSIQWAKDNPKVHGITESTNRRRGKTSISMHNLWYDCSWKKNRKGGMQAQVKKDAENKFTECLIYGWQRQPDFFRPVYDYTSGVKSGIFFKTPLTRGKAILDSIDDEEADDALNSIIDYRETKSTAYDGYKLHSYSMEEGGKWVEENVYVTLNVIIPCTRDEYTIIGFIYAPTTIEELDAGGSAFIDMFEDSRPSRMKKNENGKTNTGLVSVFISAAEGLIYDEFGRSVMYDPKPEEEILDDKGKRIFKGSISLIMNERAAKKGNIQLYTQEVRKYPLSWQEAKMMDMQNSPFNVQILQNRLEQLEKIPNLYVKGNFEWLDKVDGLVHFVRDDFNGRFLVALLLDTDGSFDDGDNRESNRVNYEVIDGKKLFSPYNNRRFRMGTDPIKWVKTDDPRASKAAAYVWQMYDPNLDANVKRTEWRSHNFIVEYLFRPNEFEIYGEDMIKCMRYYGCGILPEENITNLRQYLEGRGYGNFCIFKGDFDKTIVDHTINDVYKGLSATDELVSAGVQWLVSMIENHGMRIKFPNLLRQCMTFNVKNRKKFDAVMAALWTGMASQATITDSNTDDEVSIDSIFPLYDQDGYKSSKFTY